MIDNLFDISSKVILITGAGKGLGRGYAESLAERGAIVVGIGRHEEDLKSLTKQIGNRGQKADYAVCDVSNLKSIQSAMKLIYAKYGGIDVLINNAGTEIAKPVEMVTENDFDKIISVNLKGTYMMAQEAIKYMRLHKSGRIINIGSLGSFIGLAESTVYCATKGAVVQLTKALALETAKDAININAIAPGYFLTEMTKGFFDDPVHAKWICSRIPLGRIGTYKDLIGTLVFLSSKSSEYITGQTFVVDGGWLAG